MPKRGYEDAVQDPTKSRPILPEEKIGRIMQKLDATDRNHLENQVRSDEESLESAKADPMRSQSVDLAPIKQRLAHTKMLLHRDDDLRPKSDTSRDRLASRAKEIESIIVPKMPTKREMWPKQGSIEAQRAVQHNLKYQEKYKHLELEWQDIQRKLEPDDPTAHSLELIRPD